MTSQPPLRQVSRPELAAGRHVCAMYFGDAQRDQVLLPYLNDGLARGDKCLVGIDGSEPDALYKGIDDAEGYAATDQLVVRTSRDPVVVREEFSIDRMTGFWAGAAQSALREGYEFVRFAAEAGWWMPQLPDVSELLRYETELDRYVGRYPQSILCLYDLTVYDGGLVIDLLRLHPVVILSGRTLENPYFLPADERSSNQ
jgi:hypothetical protein